ncbi:MAG: von Willebrand factor type A domain-containing protein, partial [Pseudomonadota bacterium]
MSDELKALEEAFRAQDKAVSAGSQAKADTIALAMKQFEAEKNSTAHQGNEADARPIKQGNTKGTFFDWRNLMNSLNNKFTYGLAGSASVAVLAMLVVGPNISELLQPQPNVTIINTDPAQKPESVQEEVDSNVAGRSQSLSDDSALVDQVLESEAPQPTPSEKAKVLKEARQGLDVVTQVAPAVPGVLSKRTRTESQLSQGLHFNASPRILPAPGDVVQPHYQDQGRDKFEEIKTNPVKVTTEDPVSTFSVDVDTASYAFMRSSLNNNVLPQKDAVRVEEFINYFDYAYETPADKSEPFKANVSIMPTPWNDGTKLLSIGIKGYELQQDETPPSNLVFLIDTSGSMNAPNKLPLLRNSFKLLLSNLKADDTISIVTYAGSAGTVLEPTKASDKNKILAALDKLHAGGSTAGAEGIRQAYALAEESFKDDGINRVILATDGDFNVGISDT